MELVDNKFNVQGVDLLQVAEEYGTPVYVYDSEKIVSQYHKLKNAFTVKGLKIKFACKSLTNLSVLKLLQNEGAGLDCVSINEVKMGLHVGYTAEEIIFTPNCVAFEEIEEAIQLGVNINIDNIPFLEEMGVKYGASIPVCIRINPHIQAGGNANIQVGHVGSKFGISILQFKEVEEVVKKYNLTVHGLHMHTGSDIVDAAVFLRGAKVVFDIARNFQGLRFLDFGSGFKVAYKEGDVTTHIEEVGEKLSEAFNAFCKEYGSDLELWFEPGKFLVSESGLFLVNVNLIKESPACLFAGVNSGFNHLIRPMFYDSYHTIVNVSNPSGHRRVYNVVGYICETDTFASEREIEDISVGDVLAFKNAGAYGFMMGSNFNSRVRPAEVLIHKGKANLVRDREVYEDLVRHQIEIDI